MDPVVVVVIPELGHVDRVAALDVRSPKDGAD